MHDVWMVERTSSSASVKFSRERVLRLGPILEMSSARASEEVGVGKRRERRSSCFKSFMALRAASVRRKHFLSFRRVRLGQ